MSDDRRASGLRAPRPRSGLTSGPADASSSSSATTTQPRGATTSSDPSGNPLQLSRLTDLSAKEWLNSQPLNHFKLLDIPHGQRREVSLDEWRRRAAARRRQFHAWSQSDNADLQLIATSAERPLAELDRAIADASSLRAYFASFGEALVRADLRKYFENDGAIDANEYAVLEKLAATWEIAEFQLLAMIREVTPEFTPPRVVPSALAPSAAPPLTAPSARVRPPPTPPRPSAAAPLVPAPPRPKARWGIAAILGILSVPGALVGLTYGRRAQVTSAPTTTRAATACPAGTADCDGVASNGCESALGSSAANCGACGRACAAGAHQAVSCVAGACVTRCELGHGDCDADGHSCETALASSLRHCGACRSACSAQAGWDATCVAGRCGVRCPAGTADCNNDPQDGCEVRLDDPNHCGACGVRCAGGGPHTVPACVSGTCAVTACADGYFDVDRTPGNGCEYRCRVKPGVDLPGDGDDDDCDGFDGAADAVFVSLAGNDTQDGTQPSPLRSISAAIALARRTGRRWVYIAGGTYDESVQLADGVSLIGGFATGGAWHLSRRVATVVRATRPSGDVVVAATGRGIEHLTRLVGLTLSTGDAPRGPDGRGIGTIGLRCEDCRALELVDVSITTGNASAGTPGSDGTAGLQGAEGFPGGRGSCGDEDAPGRGGEGGSSPCNGHGSSGGAGGADERAGSPGEPNAPLFAAAAGAAGDPGGAGAHGSDGLNGINGANGAPGTVAALRGLALVGGRGADGTPGTRGNGGSGGGGGGSQHCTLCDDGAGNGGGGGGGAGCGGGAGQGGQPGGSSIGVLLVRSTGARIENSSITVGNSGNGGNGGAGGRGGDGGNGGAGGRECTSDVGAGGDGGHGGNGGYGGAGGGGAAGSTYGLYLVDTAVTEDRLRIAVGAAGYGGLGGGSAAAAGRRMLRNTDALDVPTEPPRSRRSRRRARSNEQ